MTRMPILLTERLMIRPFSTDDLEPFHRISDLCFGDGTKVNDASAIEANRRMLQWKVLNQEMLAQLYQPPYGDRTMVLRRRTRLSARWGMCRVWTGLRQSLPCSLSPRGEGWGEG